MFARIRALIDRLHDVQEVNSLSDRDLADLGMTRDQVLDFLRMPRDINDRVTAMGAIFGLPETELKRDHGLWVEILSTCGHCADRGACARLLAKGDQAQPTEATFCGNREAFADLATYAA
ncbi:MAG: DUF6455 family protein [Tabrizicola sp.]|uniref:DUF6455 family protein n=1 Tax=Tabrizicola sp. TaxID=2005166 RepID=UPI002ABCFB7E|nr:DUF6455 family protein [Tabrizicola sp.]MDZ4087777.1 DUF6455 family protein [Tabrizicola sp.]